MDNAGLSNHFKILLVEDDRDVGTSLQDALEREGYSVAWKETGNAGFEYAVNHRPHLIILDVRLPDCSGFDLCAKIRHRELFQPILMLTVQADEIDKVMGLELGADDYLTKPFQLRELLSRIRALLRRTHGKYATHEEGQYAAGEILIDTIKGQVRCQNRLINLTPNEYRILVHLARHKGCVQPLRCYDYLY